MAKSIRSKRERMLRRIKKVRYEAKELQRLKDMLARAEEKNSETNSTLNKEIVSVVSAKDIKCGKAVESENLNVDKATSDSTKRRCSVSSAITLTFCGTEMDQCQKVDEGIINSLGNVEGECGVPLMAKGNHSLGGETEKGHSKNPVRRSIRDEHGNFPVWMNQREIEKITGKLKAKKILREKNKGKKKSHNKKVTKRALKRKNQRKEAKMSRKS